MENSRVICFGPFEADLRTRELRKHGLRLKLQEQPFRVLVMLAERPGELVTREEIRAKLWPQDTFLDFEHGLNAAVRRLREALNDNAVTPRFVETLPRRGYRFIAPVEQVKGPDYVPAAAAEEPQQPDARILPRWGRPYLIGTGVVLFALLLALSAGPLRDRIFSKGPPAIHSIAILPLENLSGSPEQDYFANGMTDELITEVSEISALRVIARTSSMAYKGSKKPLGEIARELNVDAVVEGTIEEAGGKVRINAQLVDASTGRNLWAASYERDSQDILRLQSDVAEAIARHVQAKLTPRERTQMAAQRPVNPEAYTAYLKARVAANPGGWRFAANPGEWRIAAKYYQQAIEKDPRYANAYAGLAGLYVGLGNYEMLPPHEAYPKAKAAALKALELDNNLARGHSALAWTKLRYDWDWDGAEAEFKRTIELSPSDEDAHAAYAMFLSFMGRTREATAQARLAERLDPLDMYPFFCMGNAFYMSRRFDGAIGELRKSIEQFDLERGSPMTHALIGRSYEGKGMFRKAIAEQEKAVALLPETPLYLGMLGNIYGLVGKKAKALNVLNRLKEQSKRKYVSPYDMALVYIGLGDKDEAFAWLDKAYAARSNDMSNLKEDPMFDPIRSDPRFRALLRRMNFPK